MYIPFYVIKLPCLLNLNHIFRTQYRNVMWPECVFIEMKENKQTNGVEQTEKLKINVSNFICTVSLGSIFYLKAALTQYD